MSSKENGKLAPKRDRYWSVMLVGDRGRIIPFRHFKAIAITVCCGSLLLLAALTVMAILYVGVEQKVERLENQLLDAQLQNGKLRDEKDHYLTKLALVQNQDKANPVTTKRKESPVKESLKEETQRDESPKAAAAKPTGPKAAPPREPATPAKKRVAPVKKQQSRVDWKADIRRFSVTYSPNREILKAQFRIYNTTKPKRKLSGRSVVVFKVMGDTPIKWVPVPRVELRDGEPLGTRGHAFKVNNYITMKFRAYRQKAPILLNTATVFVFSDQGRLLVSKDFAFKIDAPPPAKKTPQAPTEKTPEKSTPPKENKQEKSAPAADAPVNTSPGAPAVITPPGTDNSRTRTAPATPLRPEGDTQTTPPPPATPESTPSGEASPTPVVPSSEETSPSPATPSSGDPPPSDPPEKVIPKQLLPATEPIVTTPQPKVEGE